MVITKIDYPFPAWIVIGNTARNFPLLNISSRGRILCVPVVQIIHGQLTHFHHQNYWPLDDFNHHSCHFKTEDHGFQWAVIWWCDILILNNDG